MARQRPWQVKSTSVRLPGLTVNTKSIDNLLAAMLDSQPQLCNSDIKMVEQDDGESGETLEIYRKVFAERNKIVAA